MKSKILFASLFLLVFSSCLKDYHGKGPGFDDITLTSENFLYESDLENFFLKDTILAIENRIDKLKKTPVDSPDYNDDQAVIMELEQEKSNFEIRLGALIDLSSVGLNFPIPCDQPNGKCVPVRFEFLLVNSSITEAFAVVRNEEGKNIAASAELSPFPDFESELQYLRFPVVEGQEQLTILIGKKDNKGNESMYEVAL